MDMTTPKDALFEGKPVLRLGNISDPTVTLWRAPVSKDTHSLVVVCPGGGYEILAMDLEGTEICQWLNTIGVNAALLKYRVPVRNGWQRHTAPLQDVQRALGLVRFHAADWNVDPNRIGVMGFSAGGHLAALASTRFGQRGYEPQDEADRTSCRPDFAMVIYPAYLLAGAGPELAPEITVTSNTTPTFLVQTEDDPLQVETSLFYYLALKRAQVPVEMHLFASRRPCLWSSQDGRPRRNLDAARGGVVAIPSRSSPRELWRQQDRQYPNGPLARLAIQLDASAGGFI